MLKENVQEGINEQIRHELYSAYLYLSMSAHFEDQFWKGFAHWMRLQATEELKHALRLFDFVLRRGGRPTLKPIDQPPASFTSPLDIFQRALEHERTNTGAINQLFELAISEKDYPTRVEVEWFITEQVEEENTAEEIVERAKLAGDDRGALLLLDQQLGGRTSSD